MSVVQSTLVGFLHWLPLVLALAFLAQVGLLGLRPGLEELEYLESRRPEVEARNASLRASFLELNQAVEAWKDPVYLERVRRWKAQQSGN